jgi:hypothetical protein
MCITVLSRFEMGLSSPLLQGQDGKRSCYYVGSSYKMCRMRGFADNRNKLSALLSEGFVSVSKYQNIFHSLDNFLIFKKYFQYFVFLVHLKSF